MAFIKFTNYPRLERAVLQAEKELQLQESKHNGQVGSRAMILPVKHQLERIQDLTKIAKLRNYSAIYIDLNEAELIEKLAPKE
ncbi:MAG: hypothetical protein DRQ47_01880 [Gammaproteobacteria bacterium]|nr:MAG: hypothetical protein DRQ47_01880 [Gammaproteobacteria bacterium]